VRVAAGLGAEVLVTSNACGALNSAFSVGDFVIVCDHINLPGLCGLNPLMGLCDDRQLVVAFYLKLVLFVRFVIT